MFVSNPAVLPLARACGLVDEAYDYGSLLWSELFSSSGIRSQELQKLLHTVDEAIGWLRDPGGVVQHNLHTLAIPHVVIAPGRPPENRVVHIAIYLAQTVGLVDDVRLTYRLPLLSASASKAADWLKCFAVHPGSGGARKCWPTTYFADVIKALWNRDIPVLLLSGPADEERLAQLLTLLPTPARPSLLTRLHNAPLLDVARQLQSCRGYLGNDSGITHLAAMLGVPTLALFGPTNPAIWHPIGPSVRVLYEEEMVQLRPDRVIAAIEKVL
jgi:hypothetical protein